jgi:hypothetical protein
METSREVDKVSEQKIEEFWRDATADDVAKVMRGEAVKARFRDESKDHWTSGFDSFLAGGVVSHREVIAWISKTTIRWQQCQVYEPPLWFVNKPKPGEGFRLLEKFPHEAKLATDDTWHSLAKKWLTVINDNGVQAVDAWYRRRIANNPTSSDSPRSSDNIPSGWLLLGNDEERLASDAYWSLGSQDWIVIGDDRVKYANEPGKWHAIRQMAYHFDYALVDEYFYHLPNGQTIRVTAKGFEVG